MSSWATPEQARAIWPDAKVASIAEDKLLQLLEDATEQLAQYAPAVPVAPDGSLTIPGRYRRACVLQARELYTAASRDGDLIGDGELALRARPLGATVRALLRPERGVPAVG